jgi:hypothetical protein
MTDISSLNHMSFNEFDSSLLLTVGNGLTISGSTYTASATGIGLATYDNWLGVIGAPDPSDTTSINTFIPATSTPNVLEYTITTADGSVSPASGGIGAEVVAYNATGVLLEQLTGYVPGTNALIVPDGEYFILASPSVDLSVTYGPGPTAAELTFGTTGPFPSLAAVPEPSTVMLMPLMVVALMVSRMPAVRSFLSAR